MTIADQVLELLNAHPQGLDDDQIAEMLHLSRRQTVNQVARRLAEANKIKRLNTPGKIRNYPLVGAKLDAPPPNREPSEPTAEPPWHWEGNVQAAIVEELVTDGWTIVSLANTASKAPGKDIIAERAGRALWVSVKGYPVGTAKTNAPTQARHWFSHAVFDMVLYRGENSDVGLAIGLPDFSTYRALAKRVAWLEKTTPFTYRWVSGPR